MNVLPDLSTCTVAVIGLGYVGLPLAVELAKLQPVAAQVLKLKQRVIGFDTNSGVWLNCDRA